MSKTIKRLVFTLIIFALILVGMSTIIKAEDTQFKLDKQTLNLQLNGTGYLYVNNKPSGETVTWESSDPTVAIVDNTGTVTGLAIGTATITATAGTETATCEVSVAYASISIGANSNNSTVTSVNLVLGEHPTETLIATVEDDDYKKVENATVTWKSNNPNVATVDNTGKVTAVSVGTTTITAEAAGVSDACEITVAAAPKFTDFSNAKYELLFDYSVDLKITGITPIENNSYYYIITSTNTKPTISTTSYGALDTENTVGVEGLSYNIDEKYIYDTYLDKYLELNQDLYLWIIEDVRLDASYAESEENSYISHSTKFVVEGQKLTRPKLPQLNLILRSLSIWGGTKEEQESTHISFRFPSTVENRKFKLKIGKVTDNAILKKIQNNDYSGITALLEYAKNNKAVYEANLTTTSENYYSSKQALFDGVKLLQDDAYYYIYVEFDDENGKYYPIEGITLGQAWIADSKEYWDLWAYTEDNFEWNNLSSSYTEEEKEPVKEEVKDDTIAKDELPDTGVRMVVIISIFTLAGAVVFFKIKNNKYKGI
ncbi:MAG: Ig-like domain-containing protein [Clostridia bacterium]|nr:Ig-like domain-containing protein [Clostridia bacterium]